MPLPDDAALLAYLDGELDAAERKRLEKQLEGSWELRTRLAALERDIANCMEVLEQAPTPPLVPAGRVWDAIAPHLTQRRRLPWKRWTLVASLVIAGGLAAYLRLGNVPSISAAEVVARAADAEAAGLQRVKRPVVHRKMRVRRLTAGQTRSVDWELWTEAVSGRTHEQVEANSESRAMLGRLRTLLDHNRLDSRRPLSPQAWADWRRTVTPREERIERAPGTISVETRFNATGEAPLVAARLTVRSTDWAAVEQVFTVNEPAGPSTFEIQETSSAVLAYQSLPAGLFEPDAPPPIVARAETPVAPPLQPELAPEAPAESVNPEALAAAMLAANAALHKAGLCGDAPLPELTISGGRLDVTGSVRTAERKAQLLAALGDIALLRLDLQVEPVAAPPVSSVRVLLGSHDSDAAAASLESLLAAIRADAAALSWHVLHAPDGSLEQEPLRQVLDEHRTALHANLAEAAALTEASAANGTPLPFPTGGTGRERWLALAAAASRVTTGEGLSPTDLRATLLALSAAAQ